MKPTSCFMLALTLAATAQEPKMSYAAVDFPGAVSTTIAAINDGGQIAGFYQDAAGRTHGFVRVGDKYSSIDFPESAWTIARGVSAAGEVLGTYRMAGEPNANQHGYRLDRDGRFSKFDFPGHVSTVPVRLLPDGSIVGCYHDAAGMDSMHGMTFVKSAFVGFDRAMTMHEGITPDGRTIVGYLTEMTPMAHNRGYVLEGTNFTPFDVPGSVSTTALDINAAGMIVGTYQMPATQSHGFVREGSHYTTLDVPNSKNTSAWGINAAGTIVGSFADASGVTRGFVATRR